MNEIYQNRRSSWLSGTKNNPDFAKYLRIQQQQKKKKFQQAYSQGQSNMKAFVDSKSSKSGFDQTIKQRQHFDTQAKNKAKKVLNGECSQVYRDLVTDYNKSNILKAQQQFNPILQKYKKQIICSPIKIDSSKVQNQKFDQKVENLIFDKITNRNIQIQSPEKQESRELNFNQVQIYNPITCQIQLSPAFKNIANGKIRYFNQSRVIENQNKRESIPLVETVKSLDMLQNSQKKENRATEILTAKTNERIASFFNRLSQKQYKNFSQIQF